MRFTCLCLGFFLLAFSASAQDKPDKKVANPQSPVSVLVNGQPIRGKVLEVDGKHFVAVEDLAQSLRGTLAYSEVQIALTLPNVPAPAPPPSMPQPPAAVAPVAAPKPAAVPVPPPAQPLPAVAAQTGETGRAKGTLTYFFDFHTGNKPDVGSKVWLVKDHVEIPANQYFVGSSIALGTKENPQQYTAIQYAIADADGNFEFRDIPVGQYTLIVQSAHTKGTLKGKRSFFGRGNQNSPRDSSGRVESLNILIKAGETIDASKDFGPNIDM